MAEDASTDGDVGKALREARERRGLSVRQVANTTKISVSVIQALERNDASRLPGGIFSRAFVRAVAVEVGLDPEETVRAFLARAPDVGSVAPRHALAEAELNHALESDRRTALTVLRLVMLSVPVAAVVLYLGIAGRRALRPSNAPGASSAANRSGRAERSAPVLALARPEGTPEPTPLPQDTRQETDATPETSQPPAGEPDRNRLVVGLSAARRCWVSATIDGRVDAGRLLQAGEQRSFEVNREFVLTAGDASAITMTLNGAEAKPLGRAGQVVTARVNLDNFRQYLLER